MTGPGDDPGAGGEPEPFYRQFDAAEMLAYFAELDEELQTLGSPPVRPIPDRRPRSTHPHRGQPSQTRIQQRPRPRIAVQLRRRPLRLLPRPPFRRRNPPSREQHAPTPSSSGKRNQGRSLFPRSTHLHRRRGSPPLTPTAVLPPGSGGSTAIIPELSGTGHRAHATAHRWDLVHKGGPS